MGLLRYAFIIKPQTDIHSDQILAASTMLRCHYTEICGVGYFFTQLGSSVIFQILKTQLHMILHVIHKLIWEDNALI